MALSKMKALHQMQAVRKFTDRETARGAFFRAFDAYLNGKSTLRILMYYGVGGIGKTTLLRHLEQEISPTADDNSSLDVVEINLESAQFDTPAICLLAIRNQLSFRCRAFEYALARFWSLQGWSLDDIKRQSIKQDSLLFDLIEVASDVTGIFAPARLVHRLLEQGSELVQRWFGEEKLIIQEIDGLSEEEIEKRLPYYLGLSIEKAAIRQAQRFVFFLDAHDTILYRASFHTTKHAGDEWLRELIGSAENGLYVIAGREYLKWADYNTEWKDYLEQHILGKLTDKDADYFLSSIPIEEAEIRQAIIETAHGVPLYLDLCASTYVMRKQSREIIREEDFRLAERDVIRRFVSHLDREQAESLKVCALVERFDQELFIALTNSFNIQFPVTLFEGFCETSYTVTVNARARIYKIHDSVRGFISDEMDPSLAYRAIVTVLDHCNQGFTLYGASRIGWVYQQAFVLLANYGLCLQPRESSHIVETGIRLIDTGHWKIVEASISRILKDSDVSAIDIPAGIYFLRALCLRKRGALVEAHELYANLLDAAKDLEPWTPLVRFHASHTGHLLGHYTEALKQYKELASIEAYSPISEQAKQLANRQIADILMLRGQFIDALSSFKSLTRVIDDNLWYAELHRFQGHVCRFNFSLVEAEGHYREALELSISVNADAMRAKSLTNMAETLCWIAPQTALPFAEEAIDLNEQVKAPIEVGKAMTAQAIALASIPHHASDALVVAKSAEELQAKNGYRSGTLFALQAQGLALVAQNQLEDALSILEHMKLLSVELGNIYPYLSILLSLILCPEQLDFYANNFQWLDFDQTLNTIRALAKNFSPNRHI